MLITDKNVLRSYGAPYRLWQGIPSIEVTKGGRMFVTFYSGGTKEEIGNFVLLYASRDHKSFGDPIAVACKEECRCFDPCLWIDPMGRLWFTWSCMPKGGVYAAICDDPDAEELSWHEPFLIAPEVMMNKPIALSTGEWLFPIAVWNDTLHPALDPQNECPQEKKLAFAYKTVDGGKTFERLGGVDMPHRSFDEHMLLEHNDGRIQMLVRTTYGIGRAYSYDSGKSFGECADSGLGGPCSRFYIGRLPSGRVLLVNHYNFRGRNNLTALLSDDDGKTFPYTLLLDGRHRVSYPDVAIGPDGYLYVVYDRDRGAFLDSMDRVYASAREILYAKITEEDILAGKLVSEKGELGVIVSKLGAYEGENKNPFGEFLRLSDEEKIAKILEAPKKDIWQTVFHYYPIDCVRLGGALGERFDGLIERLSAIDGDRIGAAKELISLLTDALDTDATDFPIVDTVKRIIEETDFSEFSIQEIASRAGISAYYMMHLFKKVTGTTVGEYRNALRLQRAKHLLLESDMTITEIAQACGFCSAGYFSKRFMESEHMSPSDYKKCHHRK